MSSRHPDRGSSSRHPDGARLLIDRDTGGGEDGSSLLLGDDVVSVDVGVDGGVIEELHKSETGERGGCKKIENCEDEKDLGKAYL
jgi:hypothetical protein